MIGIERLREFASDAWSLLTWEHKRGARWLALLAVLGAGAEVLSVGAILPFLQMVADPTTIHDGVTATIHAAVGAPSDATFLIWTAIFVFITTMAANGLLILQYWAQARAAASLQASFSTRLLRAYLSEPMLRQGKAASGSREKNILTESERATGYVYLPLMVFAGRAVSTAALAALLFYAEPLWSLVLLVTFGVTSAIIYTMSRRQIKMHGKQATRTNAVRQQRAMEALDAAVPLRLRARERWAGDRFDESARAYARHNAHLSFAGSWPAPIVQAIGMLAIVAIFLVMVAQGEPFEDIAPPLGFLAFAAFRLMPAFKDILRMGANARFFRPVLRDLRQHLAGSGPDVHRMPTQPLRFESLEARDLRFTFPESDAVVLRGVSLDLERGNAIGIQGPSGSGKSTLLSILLGLYPPTDGQVLVNGAPMGDQRAAWQAAIGYVPQQVVLLDESVRTNVALGDDMADGEIWNALQQAGLGEVIKAMPEGLDTRVGRRGSRLSGGQAQRLGIARALATSPQVLVLDEATANLDEATEEQIMTELERNVSALTRIIVAHRPRPLRGCDQTITLA